MQNICNKPSPAQESTFENKLFSTAAPVNITSLRYSCSPPRQLETRKNVLPIVLPLLSCGPSSLAYVQLPVFPTYLQFQSLKQTRNVCVCHVCVKNFIDDLVRPLLSMALVYVSRSVFINHSVAYSVVRQYRCNSISVQFIIDGACNHVHIVTVWL